MIARQLVLGAALVLAAGSFAAPAAAQNYPDRPIKLRGGRSRRADRSTPWRAS